VIRRAEQPQFTSPLTTEDFGTCTCTCTGTSEYPENIGGLSAAALGHAGWARCSRSAAQRTSTGPPAAISAPRTVFGMQSPLLVCSIESICSPLTSALPEFDPVGVEGGEDEQSRARAGPGDSYCARRLVVVRAGLELGRLRGIRNSPHECTLTRRQRPPGVQGLEKAAAVCRRRNGDQEDGQRVSCVR
jgi:hypothetical protein